MEIRTIRRSDARNDRNEQATRCASTENGSCQRQPFFGNFDCAIAPYCIDYRTSYDVCRLMEARQRAREPIQFKFDDYLLLSDVISIPH